MDIDVSSKGYRLSNYDEGKKIYSFHLCVCVFIYFLYFQRLASELILIDKNENLAKAQAEDIGHVAGFLGNPNIVGTKGPFSYFILNLNQKYSFMNFQLRSSLSRPNLQITVSREMQQFASSPRVQVRIRVTRKNRRCFWKIWKFSKPSFRTSVNLHPTVSSSSRVIQVRIFTSLANEQDVRK